MGFSTRACTAVRGLRRYAVTRVSPLQYNGQRQMTKTTEQYNGQSQVTINAPQPSVAVGMTQVPPRPLTAGLDDDVHCNVTIIVRETCILLRKSLLFAVLSVDVVWF